MTDWSQKKCLGCEGGVPPLASATVAEYLPHIPGWQLSADGREIYREFNFTSYVRTIAFVNAIAWMAEQENHHPICVLNYRSCVIRYTTHALQGLSDNDFICAAKVNELYAR